MIRIVKGDITKIRDVQAIVNAANNKDNQRADIICN